MKFIHGHYTDHPERRGWITGSFYPEEVINHDERVEVKIDVYAESTSAKPHYHTVKKSWTIVLQGQLQMVFDGTRMDINAGEYVISEPGVVEELLGCASNTIYVSLHAPSGELDKVEL